MAKAAFLLMICPFGLASQELPKGWLECADQIRNATQDAVSVCENTAQDGQPELQAYLGSLYYTGDAGFPLDYSKAEAWWRKAAQQGAAEAQCGLGLLYHQGQSVPQDYSEAAKWYGKAAEKGYPPAQVGLGTLYLEGSGVPQNLHEAAKLVRQAAEQGNADGQFALGTLYATVGNGVPQDFALAHMWLNLAAAQGHEQAKTFLPGLAASMTPDQIAEAQRLAREWSSGAADSPPRTLTVSGLRLSENPFRDCIGDMTLNKSGVEFFPTKGDCSLEMDLQWADVRSLRFRYQPNPIFIYSATLWLQTGDAVYEIDGIPAAITRLRKFSRLLAPGIPYECVGGQGTPCSQ